MIVVSSALKTVTVAKAKGCLVVESVNLPFNVPCPKENEDAIQLSKMTIKVFLIVVLVRLLRYTILFVRINLYLQILEILTSGKWDG